MCELIGINPSAECVNELINYADQNSDGKISLNEFISAINRS